MLHNTEDRYGLVARLFHWTIGLAIIALIALGWYMVGLTYYDPLYHDTLDWHRSLGLIVFALVVARLVWTAFQRKPTPSAALTPVERVTSRIVHVALLVLMVVMPVSGYVISTSAGDAVSVFGLVAVPAVAKISDGLRETAVAVHFYTVYGAAALIVLHAAGALKHHVVDRDDTLRRMI